MEENFSSYEPLEPLESLTPDVAVDFETDKEIVIARSRRHSAGTGAAGAKPKRRRGMKLRGRKNKRAATPLDEAQALQAQETIARMVVPNLILPAQTLPEAEDCAEYKLLRAMLLGAVMELVDSYRYSPIKGRREQRRLNRETALSWFAGEPGAPVSFELCCSMFGMSADEVRGHIAKLQARLEAAGDGVAEQESRE